MSAATETKTPPAPSGGDEPMADEAGKTPLTLDARKLGLQVLGVGVLFIGVFVGLGAMLNEPLLAFSDGFVETMGGGGVLLAFFLPDAFSVPLPVDAFTAFGLLGGIPFWEVVAWASTGSLVGGCVGYQVGGWLRGFAWFRRFYGKRAEEMDELVNRYGITALAVAALTPLPYSLACWACGALQMRFSTFLLVSLLRIPRVAGYLAIIHFGLMTVTP